MEMGGFSRSSREDDDGGHDDEEALKWAALERLPTYNRLKKGFLVTGSSGNAREIDVRKLGFQERKQLVDRLVGEDEEDLSRFLFKLKNRIDRYAKAPSLDFINK